MLDEVPVAYVVLEPGLERRLADRRPDRLVGDVAGAEQAPARLHDRRGTAPDERREDKKGQPAHAALHRTQPTTRRSISVNPLPTTVRIREEGPRDGWQNIDEPFIPTPVKLQLIERLLDAGIQHISVTSMVSPEWVPQLADADELLAQLGRRPGVSYEVLVPNLRGLDRLLPLVDAGVPVDEVGVVVSASEAHNRANLNRSIAETLEAIRAMSQRLDQHRPGPRRQRRDRVRLLADGRRRAADVAALVTAPRLVRRAGDRPRRHDRNGQSAAGHGRHGRGQARPPPTRRSRCISTTRGARGWRTS